VVVVHQPVLALTKRRGHLLERHQQAAGTAAAGGDIIMGGHIHLPYVRSLRTRFADLPRDMWTVQAGTSVSSRLREGITNSVNLIRPVVGSGFRKCMVERWDYVDAGARFQRHSTEIHNEYRTRVRLAS
jgi:hypothetical protein